MWIGDAWREGEAMVRGMEERGTKRGRDGGMERGKERGTERGMEGERDGEKRDIAPGPLSPISFM